jgi:hypothetical protein
MHGTWDLYRAASKVIAVDITSRSANTANTSMYI